MKLRQRISLFLVAGLFTLGLTIAVTFTSNRPLTAAHTNAVAINLEPPEKTPIPTPAEPPKIIGGG
jgi:hypothetical protein